MLELGTTSLPYEEREPYNLACGVSYHKYMNLGSTLLK